MKKTINTLTTCSLLFCLFSFLACEPEANEPQFDFNAFQQELQLNQDYVAYMEASTVLFQQMRNQEIDFFGIHYHLMEQGMTSYCDVNVEDLSAFKGAAECIEGICTMINHMTTLLSTVPEFAVLEEAQYLTLFVDKRIATLPQAATTRVDCLDEFYFDVMVSNFACEAQYYMLTDVGLAFCLDCCITTGVNDAAIAYDACCNNGGSGCP